MNDLKKFIRDIPDFPKKGIIFHDITPLLQNAEAFMAAIERMAEMLNGREIDYLVGIESRGFIFASALAIKLRTGLVIVRKPGKLPWETVRETYALEYGSDSLEIHADAFANGARVIVLDDVLATGGTARAKVDLVERLGGVVVGALFVIELTFLDGRERLEGTDVHALIAY